MSLPDRLTLSEIEEMPVIESWSTDDLIHEDNEFRILVSRMTVSDGASCNNEVTVEQNQNGRWETVDTYDPS